ncbi:TetR/AcrR family transcriptional regulator [Paratractidigestivibacter sp.]|uniref:TetR/AcrR family transcriptional regulator n=1 Tax=Paratractidigestivibacter sp. TaxID=2847316 RepID=UPI002AC94A46|nr:TetR/AcrR family transcriptional regulator [Paratractidigestivibacter sp.]
MNKPKNKSESKYFATAARMDEAFLELIEQKDFAYITVKEICAKAGVNRSTFYLHYETVGDLLAETAEHLITQFVEYMGADPAAFIARIGERPLEELYLITPEYLTTYLSYVKEHRRIFKATVEHAATLQMVDAYRDLTRYVFIPILDRFGVPAADQSYVMRYHISGLMAIVDEWLRGDCEDSIEHIIAVIQRCVKRR